jgi:erythronate-4-phosphate dehydrogenase
MKIVADDHIPFLRGALEPYARVVYLPGAAIGPSDLKDADALITRTRTQCDRAMLEGSRVKLITSATAGYDHIDARACAELGIEWTNAPGCNADSVVEYVASSLVTVAVSKGLALEGQVLGVVGCGQVGSRIANMARGFGMRVLLNDPPRARAEGGAGFVELAQIQAQADIITFHTSLNMKGPDKSFHLADDAFMAGLAKKVFLINASRGEVVDNAALKAHLKRGAFSAVVLDVWENEPGIDLELMDLVDIASPHIAGYSADGKINGTTHSVRAISRFFGLGADDWTCQDAPRPRDPGLVMDCAGKTELEVIAQAVLEAYQVSRDDARLRGSVETFERQRGDYPVRRDFNYYTIKLLNPPPGLGKRLEALGFLVS